jgi:thiamine-phosphate pyrophosphorylase
MKKNLQNQCSINGLYTIIDPEQGSNIFQLTEQVILGGVNIVQYRDKINTISQKVFNANKIKNICDKYNILFIINDSADLAKEVDSDGVHVGQNDDTVEYCKKILSKEKIIGTSNNNVQEICQSIKAKVNYLAIGKVFETTTMGKKDRNIVGLDLIANTKKITDIPVVAIGGINKNNADKVIKSGADSICVVSEIIKSSNPELEAINFKRFFDYEKKI